MKRIGVAVGQTITQSARPLDTVQAKDGEPNWECDNQPHEKMVARCYRGRHTIEYGRHRSVH